MSSKEPDNFNNMQNNHLIDEAARLLLKLKENQENPFIKAEINIWQRKSPEHARAWMSAQKVWSLTGQLSDDIARNTLPINDNKKPLLTRRAIATGGIAACAAVLAAPLIQDYVIADYHTNIGESRNISLNDGTKIYLDTNSSIIVKVNDKIRSVELLSGRAWFDVTKDVTRPFIVNAKDVVVKVLGTKFDTSMNKHQISVNLAQGLVRLIYKDKSGNKELNLTNGTGFIFDRINRSGILRNVSANIMCAWRYGKLITEGASISEIAQDIRPYFNGRIIIPDKAFAQKRVTGSFNLKNPLEALIAATSVHGGQVRRISPWLLVVTQS